MPKSATVKSACLRSGLEAAHEFGLLLGEQGCLDELAAACLFAGVTIAEWPGLSSTKRRYYQRRARQILETCSRRSPIYDSVEGDPPRRVWRVCRLTW
jgi:hypothetical protein